VRSYSKRYKFDAPEIKGNNRQTKLKYNQHKGTPITPKIPQYNSRTTHP
jgi:hypothetical protein